MRGGAVRFARFVADVLVLHVALVPVVHQQGLGVADLILRNRQRRLAHTQANQYLFLRGGRVDAHEPLVDGLGLLLHLLVALVSPALEDNNDNNRYPR